MHRSLLLVFLAACTREGDLTDLDTDTTTDTDPDSEVGRLGCFQDPAPEDADRVLVASQPYEGPGQNAVRYATMRMTSTGGITVTGDTFEMGRAFDGRIHFSPSGELGIAVQDDGTLGVFRVDSDGAVTVVDAGFGSGSLYATDIVWDLANERIWVVDENWRNNGGGLYTVDVDCASGALSNPALAIPSKRAAGMIPLGDDLAVVVAVDVADSAAGDDVHLVDLAAGEVVSGAAVLDDEAIYSGATLVGDGWVLFGDNAGFSSVPNRVGIARLQDDSLSAAQVIDALDDPYDIAASPWGNAALVSSGFGDALVPLRLNGETWDRGSSIAAPLPGISVVIERGALQGHVLVATASGVRHLAFTEEGTLTDEGLASFGSDTRALIGTIGIQP